MEAISTLAQLDDAIVRCRACPRLVAWREKVAQEKRAAFVNETYWGKPVPGFGDPAAAIAVVGLAPAAHGGNRTGRIFTGDRSGDVLFAALHRAGLASQSHSVARADSLVLAHTRVLAAVRCAPPANKPTPVERDACNPWFQQELALLRPTLQVIVALGAFAWNALWPTLAELQYVVPRPRPAFAHGASLSVTPAERAEGIAYPVTVLGCYHVSQQNTFTGKLTEAMVDRIFTRARTCAHL